MIGPISWPVIRHNRWPISDEQCNFDPLLFCCKIKRRTQPWIHSIFKKWNTNILLWGFLSGVFVLEVFVRGVLSRGLCPAGFCPRTLAGSCSGGWYVTGFQLMEGQERVIIIVKNMREVQFTSIWKKQAWTEEISVTFTGKLNVTINWKNFFLQIWCRRFEHGTSRLWGERATNWAILSYQIIFRWN